eukprot:gb/GFBE01029690.1/.p1 GENE.gb/GFBE01029690.1/~~gb/GFBE01029690.1/.p1  ORF type:complete len:518 (+),score=49.04 gb/GFBE01029690.1/:1-1554(+)
MTTGEQNQPAAHGAVAMSQVQACQRWVSELRGSLALLTERCGNLEQVHHGAMSKLSAIGSGQGAAVSAASPERLKRQVNARARGLTDRHTELMRSVHQLLAASDEGGLSQQPCAAGTGPSHGTPAAADRKEASGAAPTAAEPTVMKYVHEPVAPAPVTIDNDGCNATPSAAPVLTMDGPLAKMNSRLRFHDIQATPAPETPTSAVATPQRNSTRLPSRPSSAPSAGRALACGGDGGRRFPGAEPVGGRAFPGAEPVLVPHSCVSQPQAGSPSKAAARNVDRVEIIRRRAAELGSRRASLSQTQPSAAADSALYSLGNTPRSNVGSDSAGSAISDVWARFHPSRGGSGAPWRTDAGVSTAAGAEQGGEHMGQFTEPVLRSAACASATHPAMQPFPRSSSHPPMPVSIGPLPPPPTGCMDARPPTAMFGSTDGTGGFHSSNSNAGANFMPGGFSTPGLTGSASSLEAPGSMWGMSAMAANLPAPTPLPSLPAGPLGWSNFPSLTPPTLPSNMLMHQSHA